MLPSDLADDAEALARFEREARAVAQLSHPNILAIHDFGRDGETAYAVMELLEGETLRARLTHGALPARKAVELAVQMVVAENPNPGASTHLDVVVNWFSEVRQKVRQAGSP